MLCCNLLVSANDTFKNLIIMNTCGTNWNIIRPRSDLLTTVLSTLIMY